MRKRFVVSALVVIVGAIWWRRGGADAASEAAAPVRPQRDARAVVDVARAVRRVAVDDVVPKLREPLDEIDDVETVDHAPDEVQGWETGALSSIYGEVVFDGKLRDGVVVVARAPGIADEWVVLTDEHGHYRINGVPPGEVVVTFWVDERSAEHSLVLAANSGRQIDHEFQPVRSGITITEDYTRHIETARTFGDVLGAAAGEQPEGITIGDEYTRNIPTGRTFGEVLRAHCTDPDTGEGYDCADGLGVSITGVTSADNVYIVEGVPAVETGDAVGISFSGTTSLENVYLVEGIE